MAAAIRGVAAAFIRSPALIATRHREDLPGGSAGERIALCGDGIRVVIGTIGATLMRIDVPDRDGRMANVILGSDALSAYPAAGAAANDAYLGATCGRVANRIRDAAVSIDGIRHRLRANDGPHQLHGGPDGFHRRRWAVKMLDSGVRLSMTSPHGDQGWPGRLNVTATFRLVGPGTRAIGYRATTDRTTHANIVSHPYFNLAGDGAGTIADHALRIDADRFLENDADALPTGRMLPVAGGAFDFRTMTRIGDRIDQPHPQLQVGRGYNHCFVLRGGGAGLRPAARLAHQPSGRTLDLWTDRPGLHLYSGDWLDRPLAEPDGARTIGPRAGLCLEAEDFPDAANLWPDASTLLVPGRLYRSRLLLRFGTA